MSSTVQLTATKLYKTTPNTPVSLTVVVGNGNVGGTTVQLNSTTISPDSGVIENLVVGSEGQNLAGSLLVCTTNVRDINSSTNSTSVTYTLSGGPEEQSFPFQIDVSESGGFAMYSITFGFY